MNRNGGGPLKVGLITCICLVIGNMIGTGVFTSLGYQAASLSSAFAIMAVWICGGVFALCGALCYAELASALPRSGGEYHFLGRIYHPALGLMAGLVSIVAGFAAPTALAAMAFGHYFQGILPATSPVAASLALVTVTTLIHLLNIQSSRLFQNLFTALKMILIFVFISIGFFHPSPEPVSFLPGSDGVGEIFTVTFAISLMFAMYAYSGWNAAVYIAGEVKAPTRTVGLSLLLGTVLVMVTYVLLNAAFLLVVPRDIIEPAPNIGLLAAEQLFGPAGVGAVSGLVCIALITSVSAMLWIGPRVTTTMGEDHRLFALLASRRRDGVPVPAILLQYLIVVVLILTATFDQVLTYTMFALVTCSSLVVAGVFVLRMREPGLARPFRCWGYPLTPLAFLAISGFTLAHGIIGRPVEAFAGAMTLVLALLAYPLCLWYARTADEKRH